MAVPFCFNGIEKGSFVIKGENEVGIQPGLLRSIARGLMIVTIVFWLWFGIGSAYVENAGPINWLMHLLFPAGIFILSSLIAWRWGGIGGGLLAFEGILAFGFIVNAYLQGRLIASTLILMCLTLGLPPLAAGILFIIFWKQSR